MMTVRKRLDRTAWGTYIDSDGDLDFSMEIRRVCLNESECDESALESVGASLEYIDGLPYAMEWRNVSDIRIKIID